MQFKAGLESLESLYRSLPIHYPVTQSVNPYRVLYYTPFPTQHPSPALAQRAPIRDRRLFSVQ